MKQFLSQDFILENETASKLYHEFAAHLPIIDYHNHLSPKDIAEDRIFENITQAWLEGDHYKWRAMRANGINESYVTGGQTDEDKFLKWAETVPNTLRNPLYHWTHLELRRYFGIEKLLSLETAQEIYKQATAKLQTQAYSCRNLLKTMNVSVVCTTDDPISDLSYHQQLKEEQFEVKVLPTFRPDKLYAIDDPIAFSAYLETLSKVSGIRVENYDDFLKAIKQRIDFFHEVGGRLSDHGLEQLHQVSYSRKTTKDIFDQVIAEEQVSLEQQQQFQMGMLLELCQMYHAKGWVQQFHLGAIRNNNSRLLQTLGPDTGFDSIGDFSQMKAMSQFFDHLDTTDQLTKTIVYNLNPADNEPIATMVGNFNDGSVVGKMQMGSGWWFLDQKTGMENQMNALSNMGLLSRFVGMLTDSRSFLSFPRHEYFRRILCNLLGKDVEGGQLPDDMDLIGKMVENICYYNAENYFNFDGNDN